jgi:hypothetical protein
MISGQGLQSVIKLGGWGPIPFFKSKFKVGKVITLHILAGGRNVDDQNVDKPKISERRNGLFSWSERRNQNVENVFWVDQNVKNE